MIELDAMNSEHVGSHSVLDADLGVEGRHLLVISGIARPEWEIDSGEAVSQECRLRLRIPAGTIEQSTIHTGLASIENQDTAYVFSTDQSRLEVDEAGELTLITTLTTMGRKSFLRRFSYQILVTTRIAVNDITGTISWQTALFRPANATPAAVMDAIAVVANEVIGTELVPRTPGQFLSLEIGDPTSAVHYRISHPPRGKLLQVTVETPGLQVTDPLHFKLVRPVVTGTDIFTLTDEAPSRAGVDFEALQDNID